MTSGVVELPAVVRRAIVRHAREDRPRECCGLLLGTVRRIQFAVPMVNTEPGTVRYRIDDRAHIDLRRVLRSLQPPLTICGVYHSHPTGAAFPSPSDIAEAGYPEWVYLIVGFDRAAVVRAYRISKGLVRELQIRMG